GRVAGAGPRGPRGGAGGAIRVPGRAAGARHLRSCTRGGRRRWLSVPAHPRRSECVTHLPDRPAIATLRELRASGYRPRTVKEEMRANLVRKLGREETLLPAIIGYDDTVLPQIENALLAGQGVILPRGRGHGPGRSRPAVVDLGD